MAMHSRRTHIVLSAVLLVATVSRGATFQEPWETGYFNQDAVGDHVLGYWHFDKPVPPFSESERFGKVVLGGATITPEGRFGDALETDHHRALPGIRAGASINHFPELSPGGAFSVEMWICPKWSFDTNAPYVLIDKRADTFTDYQWKLDALSSDGKCQLLVTLGFGDRFETFPSELIGLEPDEWHHLAFTYDGSGEVSHYVDGHLSGRSRVPNCGSITAGTLPLVIGDQMGGGRGFPGSIDEVRLCKGVLVFAAFDLEFISERRTWQRMDTPTSEYVVCTNLRPDTVTNLQLKVRYANRESTFLIESLDPGKSYRARYYVDTSIRPRRYSIHAILENNLHREEEASTFEISSRPAPQFPVVLLDRGPADISQMREVGFTHFLGIDNSIDARHRGKSFYQPGYSTPAEYNHHLLDEALSTGLHMVAALSPAENLMASPGSLVPNEHFRIDRGGNPILPLQICATHPRFEGVFQSDAQQFIVTYRSHSGLGALLLNPSLRKGTEVSFTKTDIEKYRADAHAEIPIEVLAKNGVRRNDLAAFPDDRVVSDLNPILQYYRWFWTEGDGWTSLRRAQKKGVDRRASYRTDVGLINDSALTGPCIGCPNDPVTVISHSNNADFDPRCVGLRADRLLALGAANAQNQRVMVTTDIGWKRSAFTSADSPKLQFGSSLTTDFPNATEVTLAPMLLREALWCQIARPIDGLIFRGWSSLSGDHTLNPHRHPCTHPDTMRVLSDFIGNVVEPLGTTLLTLQEQPSEVAMLQSFTNQVFTNTAASDEEPSWTTNLWLAMQHAHIQTEILFEESLLYNGLRGRKVLLMPDCEVLTEGVVSVIQKWQEQGGIVIADDALCPALKADISLERFDHVAVAEDRRAKLLGLAEDLGTHLRSRGWFPMVSCDNPEVMIRTRRFEETLYVFVWNDRRIAGNYVGEQGVVAERGLHSTAKVFVHRQDGSVYDLTTSKLLFPKRESDGQLSLDVALGPCDGKIFMITPRPILGMKMDVPEVSTVGNTAVVEVAVTNTRDQPLGAAIPIEIRVTDSNGRQAEGSGFYAGVDGIVSVNIEIASNEEPGTWEISVRELASGMTETKWMEVRR